MIFIKKDSTKLYLYDFSQNRGSQWRHQTAVQAAVVCLQVICISSWSVCSCTWDLLFPQRSQDQNSPAPSSAVKWSKWKSLLVLKIRQTQFVILYSKIQLNMFPENMLVMFLFIRIQLTCQPLQKVFQAFFVCCFHKTLLRKLMAPDIYDNICSFFFLINCLWHIRWSSHSSVFDGFRSFICVLHCKSYTDNNVIMASVMHVSSSLDLWPWWSIFDSCLWNVAVNLSLKIEIQSFLMTFKPSPYQVWLQKVQQSTSWTTIPWNL